jgi:type III pantothenate kinase
MNLLLDIGNTRIKWAVHDGRSPCNKFVASGVLLYQSGISIALTEIYSDLDRLALGPVSGVWVVNVAGDAVRNEVELFTQQQYSIYPKFAESAVAAQGLTNGYSDPALLGVDRWVAMIGAVAQINEPICIVDAGTAVTIDFVSEGTHLGGLILPGLNLMQSELFRATVDIEHFADFGSGELNNCEGLGIDTDSAVRNGAVQAISGAVHFSVRKQTEKYGSFKLIATGGDAFMLPAMLDDLAIDCKPMLVLEGLAEIAS